MSFSGYARQVRDARRPYAYRVGALRSCVQLYCPFGFHLTLEVLEAIAGPYRTDETALLRALDALTQSRAEWLAELRRYAAGRRAAKARGHRSPHPADTDPNLRRGSAKDKAGPARHALRYWQRHRPPDPDDALAACVTACLDSGGRLTAQQRRTLLDYVTEPRNDRPTSWAEYYRAHHLPIIARLVWLASTPTAR